MKLSFVAALLVALAAGAAQANDANCRPNPARTVDAFETAKDALLRGEFDRFFTTVQPFGNRSDPDRMRAAQRFSNTFPNGFRECASVVFRSEAPGLFQEIVLYDTGGAPLALYLRGARFRRDVIIIDFALSDRATEVIDLLE
ncbi:MAG: hypothetical protein AAFR34_00835 [Pseudomonadota bacterium]